MPSLSISRAEAYSREIFQCGSCNRDFEAEVITWIDASRAPQAKQLVLRWEFNAVQCTHCGCRSLATTPFFYEDFEEGLLIAVFPRLPEKRGDMERNIRERYGYYPVLEFFYDSTQLWMLLYFQEYYKKNENRSARRSAGIGEERLHKILRFLKEDPLMLKLREKLTESFFGDETSDELADILGQAVYTVEEMLPWPMDLRCRCGADLSLEFECCGSRLDLEAHKQLLSPRYSIYCPACKESFSGATCSACGKTFTWKLGTVDSYREQKEPAREEGKLLTPRADHPAR